MFENFKDDLVRATELTLRLAKPGLQYVLLCCASYYSVSFVLMIEDYVKAEKPKIEKPMHQLPLEQNCSTKLNLISRLTTKCFWVLILH